MLNTRQSFSKLKSSLQIYDPNSAGKQIKCTVFRDTEQEKRWDPPRHPPGGAIVVTSIHAGTKPPPRALHQYRTDTESIRVYCTLLLLLNYERAASSNVSAENTKDKQERNRFCHHGLKWVRQSHISNVPSANTIGETIIEAFQFVALLLEGCHTVSEWSIAPHNRNWLDQLEQARRMRIRSNRGAHSLHLPMSEVAPLQSIENNTSLVWKTTIVSYVNAFVLGYWLLNVPLKEQWVGRTAWAILMLRRAASLQRLAVLRKAYHPLFGEESNTTTNNNHNNTCLNSLWNWITWSRQSSTHRHWSVVLRRFKGF